MEHKWHTLSHEETFEKLATTRLGLSAQEAAKRIAQYGPNSLPEKKGTSLPMIFLGQFNSSLILVLLAASIVTYVIGEVTDASIILAVLIFNAIVGTIQEGKAQNTLNALKQFVETKATVIRDGMEFVISDKELVPGDLIDLQEGEKVPADARVITSQSIKVDEAALTGESEAVYKTADTLKHESVTSGDQKNMLFKGTHVVSGNGRAIVVATGYQTVIGKIAKEISSIDTEIPLKANIRYLSHAIIAVVAGISVLLFIVGILKGETALKMFTVVVSLAVSVIPEGLPIVMTLVLATGVWRMSKRNALVKKLQAVEALGQAEVIAVDKTGTITKNELVVRQVWTAQKLFDVSGVGYEPKGEISFQEEVVDAANHPEMLVIGKAVALCSNARLSLSESKNSWTIKGDPTEAAMVVFAEKVGFKREDLLNETPVISEMPFDYRLKYRAVINSAGKKNSMIVIGAPEVLMALCKNIVTAKGSPKFTDEHKAEAEKMLLRMSEQGQRVVGVAMKQNLAKSDATPEVEGLTFVGFLAMKDVLRPEVSGAIKIAVEAGIRVMMITGDHKITARSIAKEAGIFHEGDELLTGAEIDSMSDTELKEKLAHTTVFARVTPEHKLRIIKAFKARGQIIAMTGDGVNDAPSLVAADLGISMGLIGTEVAKEASDIVLLDDDFGSIVAAVEEGRNIYKTIKKVILYLFSTSIGEVLTIVVALFIGLPLPLLASQIIWLNFVTDGFLDVSLAMEPKEKGLLTGSFERPKKYLVDRLMMVRMVLMSIPMMAGTLFLFSIYHVESLEKGWTISLVTLAVFQWFNAWNCRSETKSIFKINPFSNKYLVGATVLVIILQVLAVYTPFLQKILHTVPIDAHDWLVVIIVASSILIVEESRKFFYRNAVTLKKS